MQTIIEVKNQEDLQRFDQATVEYRSDLTSDRSGTRDIFFHQIDFEFLYTRHHITTCVQHSLGMSGHDEDTVIFLGTRCMDS